MKFFRTLRQRLLAENKVTRYLAYALGEVVLVMIGILLALQVNNWNEDRKSRASERALLQSLLADLELALDQSDFMIQREQNIMDGAASALGLLEGGPEVTARTFSDTEAYFVLWVDQTTLPVINAFAELQGSGKAMELRSPQIREALANLDLQMNDLRRAADDRLKAQQERLDVILETDIQTERLLTVNDDTLHGARGFRILAPENDYPALFQDPRVRNLLSIKILHTQSVLAGRQRLHQQIQKLIGLLRSELATP